MICDVQRGRIRGVLGYRMGQQFQMGSYPFHFHMAGEVPSDSYMTDNAVYASYWRGALMEASGCVYCEGCRCRMAIPNLP